MPGAGFFRSGRRKDRVSPSRAASDGECADDRPIPLQDFTESEIAIFTVAEQAPGRRSSFHRGLLTSKSRSVIFAPSPFDFPGWNS